MQEVQWDFTPRGNKAHCRIYILSDVHLGHAASHKALFKRHIDQIRQDPEAHVLLLGDLMDGIGTTDKRFQLSQLDPDCLSERRDDIINWQVEAAEDLLGPITGKIRLILAGNHEEGLTRHGGGADPLRSLARRLGLDEPPPGCVLGKPYEAAYTAYCRLRWPDKTGKYRPHWWTVDLALHHGAGGGRKPGAKVNRVDDRASWWPTAQVVASGHNHSRTLTERVGISVSAKSFHQEQVTQVCLNTGSYMRTYMANATGSHYAERGDYPPSALGGVFVDVAFEDAEVGGERRRNVLLSGGFL